ncbi:MAG TPA: hypothetical protein ENH55_16690 [Aurantimonas coralicida]|uniref:LamG-like jellyroll fold domain-containing protein n=1 Tax=marine sediment metagenome TaxID=412755 RepID=A0A0F9RBT5_9ZZZZ|nr:hypothetical protein [Aurantimonas coralicida]
MLRLTNLAGFSAAKARGQAIPGNPPVTDPDFASVKLLLGFNGVDGATITADESDNAAVLNSFIENAQLDQAQQKWGSASLLLDGDGDAVHWDDDADFAIGSGEYTIDAWLRPASVPGVNVVFLEQWSSVQRSISFGTHATGTQISLRTSTTGNTTTSTLLSGTLTWNVDQWYHVASDRDSGGVIRIYRDGVFLAKHTQATTLHDSTRVLEVGTDFDGHIDDLRYTVGVARYASDSGYTVPTEAFPRQ